MLIGAGSDLKCPRVAVSKGGYVVGRESGVLDGDADGFRPEVVWTGCRAHNQAWDTDGVSTRLVLRRM